VQANNWGTPRVRWDNGWYEDVDASELKIDKARTSVLGNALALFDRATTAKNPDWHAVALALCAALVSQKGAALPRPRRVKNNASTTTPRLNAVGKPYSPSYDPNYRMKYKPRRYAPGGPNLGGMEYTIPSKTGVPRKWEL